MQPAFELGASMRFTQARSTHVRKVHSQDPNAPATCHLPRVTRVQAAGSTLYASFATSYGKHAADPKKYKLVLDVLNGGIHSR